MTYPVGSFFVVDVAGPGGYWIGLAQALAGNASRYKHAGVVRDAQGAILEGEPHGARLGNLSEYAGRAVLVCDGPILSLPEEEQAAARARVAAAIDHREGTPYSWLDYGAIALLHAVDALPKWLRKVLRPLAERLRRYVAATGHAQCAQLVDLVYRDAGIHLFSDPARREEGDVMPADLAAWAEDWQGAHADWEANQYLLAKPRPEKGNPA